MTIYDPIIHYYIVTPTAGSITVPVQKLRRFNHHWSLSGATITASATPTKTAGSRPAEPCVAATTATQWIEQTPPVPTTNKENSWKQLLQNAWVQAIVQAIPFHPKHHTLPTSEKSGLKTREIDILKLSQLHDPLRPLGVLPLAWGSLQGIVQCIWPCIPCGCEAIPKITKLSSQLAGMFAYPWSPLEWS